MYFHWFALITYFTKSLENESRADGKYPHTFYIIQNAIWLLKSSFFFLAKIKNWWNYMAHKRNRLIRKISYKWMFYCKKALFRQTEVYIWVWLSEQTAKLAYIHNTHMHIIRLIHIVEKRGSERLTHISPVKKCLKIFFESRQASYPDGHWMDNIFPMSILFSDVLSRFILMHIVSMAVPATRHGKALGRTNCFGTLFSRSTVLSRSFLPHHSTSVKNENGYGPGPHPSLPVQHRR